MASQDGRSFQLTSPFCARRITHAIFVAPMQVAFLLTDILQMEASTSPNLSQLANVDKPMTTPAAFDRCPDARSGWRAGEILNLPS